MTPGSKPIVLEARGLVRAYGGEKAVDGVDLRLHAGEVYGFLGRNGAGKTTTIKTLMGIAKSDQGTVSILGADTRRPGTREKRLIGYVAQEQHFYPWMTCAELGRFVGGLYPSWDAAEFDRLLELFMLPPKKKSSALSHGMRVKLALSLALAPRPPLLILDEPSAGLDPVARRELLDLIGTCARADHRAIFFSTHLVDEVERVADRVGIIDRGKMIFEGTLDELRATLPAHSSQGKALDLEDAFIELLLRGKNPGSAGSSSTHPATPDPSP
ncbi:MAG: ABC transporter ATP-binding protein [Deltaproteobacteria bacterium]|nr:ABC transporter ATP-binding protein [Deltaproteobacteria bacterium]